MEPIPADALTDSSSTLSLQSHSPHLAAFATDPQPTRPLALTANAVPPKKKYLLPPCAQDKKAKSAAQTADIMYKQDQLSATVLALMPSPLMLLSLRTT